MSASTGLNNRLIVNVLGISAYYHDSAAALVSNGEIISAVQEERFTRRRHDSSFPDNSCRAVLEAGGLSIADIDLVVYYERPELKFRRILSAHLKNAPASWRSFQQMLPGWITTKGRIPAQIRRHLGYRGAIDFVTHHMGHAASSYFPSPFASAAFLTIDGVGEYETTTWGVGNGSVIEMREHLLFPHSLGLLYSAFTQFLGFKVNSGEYKVMGLAPYGTDRYSRLILENVIDVCADGSFQLDMRYFDFEAGLSMINDRLESLFKRLRRAPESLLTQDDMDMAASLQVVTEEVILRLARHVRKQSDSRNLCLAGGVALNCVANGRIHREKIFDHIWVQPAAGDAGGALGAALYGYHVIGKKDRVPLHGDCQKGSLLGPSYSDDEIENFLRLNYIPYEKVGDGARAAAKLLADGNIVGWFSGRMEYGPRSLGARSLLGDARIEDMQKRMNLKIKYRESFRPFAPAVLREDVSSYFDFDDESPYMLMVAPVKESVRTALNDQQQNLFGIERLNLVRSTIPAVTHVDYSARIQTVDERRNPAFCRLLQEFKRITGCSVLINTSFNVRGEPIVCAPEDAFRCFMRTDIDVLVMEKFIVSKKDFPHLDLDRDWQQEFELD